jgi:hypothetical protein
VKAACWAPRGMDGSRLFPNWPTNAAARNVSCHRSRFSSNSRANSARTHRMMLPQLLDGWQVTSVYCEPCRALLPECFMKSGPNPSGSHCERSGCRAGAGDPGDNPPSDRIRTFDRISRSVRRSGGNHVEVAVVLVARRRTRNSPRHYRARVGSTVAADDDEMMLHISYWQILLQKSATADGSSAISLRTADFDLPTPTHSTQLPRYAMHMARAGGGRATSLRAAADSGRWRPERTHPGRFVDHVAVSAELQDALEVRKAHLDLLTPVPRLLKALDAGKGSGDISSMLMDIARDLA